MIIKATENNRNEYLAMADEFYHSDAVLHPINIECIVRGFDMMITDNPYLSGFILKYDGKTAGYAIISKMFATEVGGMCIWIEDIFVRSEYRGKGLGNEFFEFLFREYGKDTLRFRLEVEDENVGAVRLYEKLGFSKLPYSQMTVDRNS